ncbi:protein CYP 13B1, a [Trichuris trichiura]|uniref:Protein CYP 13B1, a n=1 Tax=Trichuris trichiura TaxID=36087 RepID=A0A077ZAI9_TRITR|nr:protein CYP 13B1, a [Trichuris trichiura]
MDGGVPILVVSDLEMLNDIFIKKFNCFHARKIAYLDMNEAGLKKRHMFASHGLRWKRLRSISAPAFSTIRLKQTIQNDLFSPCRKSPATFLRRLFQQLTLDSISRCAFGFEPTPSPKKEDDFLSLCAATFADTTQDNWIFTCSSIFDNALSYAIYELARHPEIQEKLRGEIMDYHKNDVQRMMYLDCVIRETLRLYPVAVVSRRCMQTCTIGGITIEKGIHVLADVWTIHYNKDIWGPDADEFVPERFAEDQLHSLHPLAWIPFGAGPRRCIGERFALLEMKLTLARLLRKYRIFLNDRTEVKSSSYASFERSKSFHPIQVPLELQEGVTNTPKNGVVLSLKLI